MPASEPQRQEAERERQNAEQHRRESEVKREISAEQQQQGKGGALLPATVFFCLLVVATSLFAFAMHEHGKCRRTCCDLALAVKLQSIIRR